MKIDEWQKRISHEKAERPLKSTHSILTILLSVTICFTSKWKQNIAEPPFSESNLYFIEIAKIEVVFAFSVCMEIFSTLGGLIGLTSIYGSNVQIYWMAYQKNNELHSVVLIVNGFLSADGLNRNRFTKVNGCFIARL